MVRGGDASYKFGMFRIVLLLILTTGIASCASRHEADPSQPARAPVALADNDVTDQFEVPDGLEVRVWARTPQLFNPTNLDVDARGRVWVTEAVNYRETLHPLRALKHPEGDRVVILEDTDGDRAADSSKVFAQEKDLVAPLGIAVIGERVVVSCSPNVIVYRDTDGDDKPDERNVFLTGFGGFDNDHGVHAVTGFLDGRWYFNTGNEGPHDVTDAAGWRLHSGSFYAVRGKNTGNRKSADGRVWTGGLALRVDADGKNLRPIAHNFRNSYELALDSFGTVWQSDNDDDGNQSCRVAFVMEGANYGYGSADGTRSWRNDRRPGQTTQPAHWHQDDPGVAPAGAFTGAGGPTGNVVYEGGLLPAKYVGCLLSADAGRNVVRAVRPVADGAGYRYEVSDLIKPKKTEGDAEGKWFRPSDVAVGTDGAIYIADWFDTMVGGHWMNDKQGGGRILRIAPRGDRPRPPKVDLASVSGQLAALHNPAVNVRHVAAVKLRERGAAVVRPLSRLKDVRERARALWVLAQCGPAGVAAVERELTSRDADLRITALRALRSVDADVVGHAAALASDPSPAVRREVAVALRDVPFEQCRDVLLKLADGYDGKDRTYLEAFGLACDGKEEPIFPLLLERFGDGETMHDFAWRLHPRSSLKLLAAQAESPQATPAGRQRAADAIAFVPDASAAEAMAQLARSGPEDVKPVAAWWLKHRAGNDWKDFQAADPFAARETEGISGAEKKRQADLATMLDASKPLRAREGAMARLARNADGGKLIVALAADDRFPKDLADAVVEPIHHNPDLSIRAMAGTYFPRKTIGGETLPPVAELAKKPGNAARGRAVFFGNTAACGRCHLFNGEGKDVGPDLTQIRTKYARPELLDAILYPSANIAFGYQPWIVQTTDGQVYSGFITADGESVTIKESSGEQRTVPAKQIKKRIRQPMSVMPDNVGLGLSSQDLADVAEFLLKAPAGSAR